PRLSPFGNPAYLLNLLQRAATQIVVVHDDEPLLRGAEDHGLLASPAVRIAVDKHLLMIKVARLLEPRSDRLVGREDVLAGKPFRSLDSDPARLVHGAEDRELIQPAGLIVLGTMARGSMHQPSPVVDTDISGQHERARAVDEGVAV